MVLASLYKSAPISDLNPGYILTLNSKFFKQLEKNPNNIIPTPRTRGFSSLFYIFPPCKQTRRSKFSLKNLSFWEGGLGGLETLLPPGLSRTANNADAAGRMALRPQTDMGTAWPVTGGNAWTGSAPSASPRTAGLCSASPICIKHKKRRGISVAASKRFLSYKVDRINAMQIRASPSTDLDHRKETRQTSRAIVRVGVETVSFTEPLSSQVGKRFTTMLTHSGNILMFEQGCTTDWPNWASQKQLACPQTLVDKSYTTQRPCPHMTQRSRNENINAAGLNTSLIVVTYQDTSSCLPSRITTVSDYIVLKLKG